MQFDLAPSDAETRGMILVTAGILTEGERVLICQRKAGDRFGLKWEFPGGKVEAGETPPTCLRRELAEELGVEAEVGPEVHRTDYRYPNGFTVRLLFFKVCRYTGVPENREFERFVWARPDELSGFDFLEADREVVDRLARGEVR
ncbi:MAG: hydrolase, family [candidate division NC10 bacterium]|jgi:8-oxo-dGTP diphosphatase|nr:hydrolase, family [candidate division NC10 bacterium]